MHVYAFRLKVKRPAKKQLPQSIFDNLEHEPSLNTREFKAPSAALGKTPKDHRFGPVRVDWVDFEDRKMNNKVEVGKGECALWMRTSFDAFQALLRLRSPQRARQSREEH